MVGSCLSLGRLWLEIRWSTFGSTFIDAIGFPLMGLTEVRTVQALVALVMNFPLFRFLRAIIPIRSSCISIEDSYRKDGCEPKSKNCCQ